MIRRSKTGAVGGVRATDFTALLSISIECRDLRHAWSHDGDADIEFASATEVRFVRVLRCTRCDTVRSDRYLIRRGLVDKLGAHYTYPPGYQIPAEVADSATIRLLTLARLLPVQTTRSIERKS